MRALINCIIVAILFSHIGETPPVIERGIEKPISHPIPRIENDVDNKIVRELHILHPTFRNRVVMLIHECRKQGIELMVVETYRSPERQDVMKRRKLSGLSGGYSKHQHYLAVDVVPIVNGKTTWHNKYLWKRIGQIGESQGLRWGGRWKSLRDYCHFEYPVPIDSIHTIPIPDTVIVPLNY